MPPINPRVLKHDQEARNALLAGIEEVYVAVSATLGPRSSNVAIARPYGRPAVVHDGVTVAKEVLPLADPFENVGAEMAVEAADRTNAIGDGTTTATVLMRNIAKGAHTLITAGAKPMALREGIEAATAAIAAQLSDMATPIDKVQDVKRIATISAQNEAIGQMVADAYKELGKEGIMSVEESRGTETFLELKTGMEFDRGYRSPYFVNDPVLQEASINKPFVLVTDHRLVNVAEFAPTLQKLTDEGVKDIVVIADEIDGEALAFLIVNHVKQNLRVLAVQAPSFGDKRTEALRDIAVITGADFISEEAGMSLGGVTKANLGSAARISSTKDTTLIVDGGGAQEDIDARSALIKTQADNPDTGDFDREKLMERYAKLKSGVAVLNVGANSEPELKEKKERAIDAISAAKAALDEGIVPGGGTALIEAAERAVPATADNGRDFDAGWDIVVKACSEPFKKLLNNSGFDPGTFVEKIGKGKGVDVMSGKVVDMVKAGIIDPVLVVKSALEHASSNAVMSATTNHIIVEKKPEPTNNNQGV